MKYRGLLLDFYGTLVAEDDAVISSICARMGESLGDPEKAKRFGRRWSELFAEMCCSSFGERFQTQRAIELDSLAVAMKEVGVRGDPAEASLELYEYWQNPATYADSHEFLATCSLPVCVVSNIDTKDIEAAAAAHGWSFENLITSEMLRSYKPRPEMFLAGLDRLGMKPAEVLHVGDSLSADIRGASAVGMDTAWINQKGRRLPENHVSPTFECRDLSELLGIIHNG